MNSPSRSTRSSFPTLFRMCLLRESTAWRRRRKRLRSSPRSSAGNAPGGWWTDSLALREQTEAYLQELKAIELIYEKALFLELARQAYIAARDVVKRMKVGVKNPDLQANLEGSPIIRHFPWLCYAGTFNLSYKNSGAKSAPLGHTTV